MTFITLIYDRGISYREQTDVCFCDVPVKPDQSKAMVTSCEEDPPGSELVSFSVLYDRSVMSQDGGDDRLRVLQTHTRAGGCGLEPA